MLIYQEVKIPWRDHADLIEFTFSDSSKVLWNIAPTDFQVFEWLFCAGPVFQSLEKEFSISRLCHCHCNFTMWQHKDWALTHLAALNEIHTCMFNRYPGISTVCTLPTAGFMLLYICSAVQGVIHKDLTVQQQIELQKPLSSVSIYILLL